MVFLVKVWTQIFCLGIGGICGALVVPALFGNLKQNDKVFFVGGGIFLGAFFGLVFGRSLLKYSESKTPPDARTRVATNLTPCPDCNHMVSRIAPTCPNCGRPFPPPIT